MSCFLPSCGWLSRSSSGSSPARLSAGGIFGPRTSSPSSSPRGRRSPQALPEEPFESLSDLCVSYISNNIEFFRASEFEGVVNTGMLLLWESIKSSKRKLSLNQTLALLSKSGLAELDLQDFYMTVNETTAITLSKYRVLTSINLSNCYKLSDSSIAAIASGIPLLRSLLISGCHNVTGKALIPLSQLQALEELDVGGTQLRDSDVFIFEMGFPALTRLGVSQCVGLSIYSTVFLYSLNKFSEFHYKGCNNYVKVVLLGTHQAGKSTFFNHCKFLLDGPPVLEDRNQYRDLLRTNCIEQMLTLLRLVQLHRPSVFGPDEVNRYFTKVMSLEENLVTFSKIPFRKMRYISRLWALKPVKEIFEQHKNMFLDSAQYLFDSCSRFGSRDFVPTEEDILRSRVKTTGIVEAVFEMLGVTLRIADTGCERCERKKWQLVFPYTAIVLYVGSLSEYDLLCYEDARTNRMKESIMVFKEINQSYQLRNADLFLILNKRDVLEKKIEQSRLQDVFDAYSGDPSPEEHTRFIQGEYVGNQQTNLLQTRCSEPEDREAIYSAGYRSPLLNSTANESYLEALNQVFSRCLMMDRQSGGLNSEAVEFATSKRTVHTMVTNSLDPLNVCDVLSQLETVLFSKLMAFGLQI